MERALNLGKERTSRRKITEGPSDVKCKDKLKD